VTQSVKFNRYYEYKLALKYFRKAKIFRGQELRELAMHKTLTYQIAISTSVQTVIPGP